MTTPILYPDGRLSRGRSRTPGLRRRQVPPACCFGYRGRDASTRPPRAIFAAFWVRSIRSGPCVPPARRFMDRAFSSRSPCAPSSRRISGCAAMTGSCAPFTRRFGGLAAWSRLSLSPLGASPRLFPPPFGPCYPSAPPPPGSMVRECPCFFRCGDPFWHSLAMPHALMSGFLRPPAPLVHRWREIARQTGCAEQSRTTPAPTSGVRPARISAAPSQYV